MNQKVEEVFFLMVSNLDQILRREASTNLLFGAVFYVAKWNSGKVNLEPMQSAVTPIYVRDLRGDP